MVWASRVSGPERSVHRDIGLPAWVLSVAPRRLGIRRVGQVPAVTIAAMAAEKYLDPPERLARTGVALRRSVTSDAPALFAAARDAEVMRFMDWPA